MANRNGLCEIRKCACGLKPRYEKSANDSYDLVCSGCGQRQHGFTKTDAREKWNRACRYDKQITRRPGRPKHD